MTQVHPLLPLIQTTATDTSVLSHFWLFGPYRSNPFSPSCLLSSWGKALTVLFPCSKTFNGSPMPTKFQLLMLLQVLLACPISHLFCPHHSQSSSLRSCSFLWTPHAPQTHTLSTSILAHTDPPLWIRMGISILSHTDTLLVEDYWELRILWATVCAKLSD